jgi:hypothetical protein
MAVSAGDVDLAITVANSIMDSFTVDALKFKVALAQDLDKSVRTPYARSDLIHFYGMLIIDALQAEQFELGRQISSSAQVAARNTDDASPGLINVIASCLATLNIIDRRSANHARSIQLTCRKLIAAKILLLLNQTGCTA